MNKDTFNNILLIIFVFGGIFLYGGRDYLFGFGVMLMVLTVVFTVFYLTMSIRVMK